MIAIFRRVRQAARDVHGAEWLLLTIELVGIVAGILIAFELEEWSAARREAREERALLSRLLEESEQTVAQLREERDQFGAMAERQQATLNTWIRDDSCPSEQAWGALGTVNFFPAMNIPSAAYDEMIASGSLSRVKSFKLREALGRLHSTKAAYDRQQDYIRAANIASDAEFDFGGEAVFDMESGRIGLDGEDLQAMCKSRDYQIHMLGRVRNFALMQNWRAGVTNAAIDLCAIVAGELGRECVPGDGTPLGEDDRQRARAALSDSD